MCDQDAFQVVGHKTESKHIDKNILYTIGWKLQINYLINSSAKKFEETVLNSSQNMITTIFTELFIGASMNKDNQ